MFLCGGVCSVATALFLAMASLVWIQPHLFLDGKQLFVICIFLQLLGYVYSCEEYCDTHVKQF